MACILGRGQDSSARRGVLTFFPGGADINYTVARRDDNHIAGYPPKPFNVSTFTADFTQTKRSVYLHCTQGCDPPVPDQYRAVSEKTLTLISERDFDLQYISVVYKTGRDLPIDRFVCVPYGCWSRRPVIKDSPVGLNLARLFMVSHQSERTTARVSHHLHNTVLYIILC